MRKEVNTKISKRTNGRLLSVNTSKMNLDKNGYNSNECH